MTAWQQDLAVKPEVVLSSTTICGAACAQQHVCRVENEGVVWILGLVERGGHADDHHIGFPNTSGCRWP